MKRSLIFLLVLLVVVGGLLYAADRAVRSHLDAALRQAQAEKQLSLSSWEYDSLSRRLVLHDVRSNLFSPETAAPFTAREIRADINLRALLHTIPQLDFLLPGKSYLTLLDAWQGTDLAQDSSMPEAGDLRLRIARVEGEGLAIPVELFKTLRDGTAKPDSMLSRGAIRSLLLENMEMSQRLPHQPLCTVTLGKVGVEKWDMQNRIGSIRLEKSALRQENVLSLQLGTLTIADLAPHALKTLADLPDEAQTWDAAIRDIPFTSFAATDVAIRQNGGSLALGELEIVRAGEARRLERISFRKARLETPPREDIALRIEDYAVQDLLLPDSALLGKFLRAVREPQLFERFLAENAPESPLFSRSLLKNLHLGSGGMSLSLELLDNVWTLEQGTQTLASTMTNFLVPPSTLQARPLPFALPGLKEIRLSMSGTQTFAGGQSRFAGKIVADSLCELEYQYEMQSKGMLGPWTGLRHLDTRLTDKGLMAVVALNIDENPAVAQMGMETLAGVIAENLPGGKEMLPALRTFIATPGELKLSIAGDDWIPIQADNPLWLLQLATRLHMEATPGKSPLADLVRAQLNKAGQ